MHPVSSMSSALHIIAYRLNKGALFNVMSGIVVFLLFCVVVLAVSVCCSFILKTSVSLAAASDRGFTSD